MTFICMNIFEYIWRDNKGNLRSKAKITTEQLPTTWNYDGSSTRQATTHSSEISLFPVKTIKDPFRRNKNSYLVLCSTSWVNDTRTIANEIFSKNTELQPMFGLEQEFFMIDKTTNAPINYEKGKKMGQDKFYCGVGITTERERTFIETVLDHCLYSEIPITGYNFEVAVSQAEFQVCDIGISASDNLILLRYVLERTGELFNIEVNYYCKPLGRDWNGSGMHCNFSTKEMREEPFAEKRTTLILESVNKLSKTHQEAMLIYGTDNHLRLTGTHETSSIEKFTYGFGSRDTSIRIPSNPENRFYFEDRRPSADADPYLVTSHIFKTTCF